MASQRVQRSRRNLIKMAGIAMGVVASTAGIAASALAQPNGNNQNGNNHDGTCFLRGTQILTTDGYRAVEKLAAGDKVLARFAGPAPIKAIDNFTLCRVNGAWVGAARPVRVKCGALGENRPATDLCMTAAHAVMVDGALVPVVSLVNGTSIVFETAAGRDSLDFFHIELERHDVLDVQGAACESLLRPAAEPCLPMLSFNGHRSELRSRLRSALSVVIDRREPLDLIRDRIEERGLELARAA